MLAAAGRMLAATGGVLGFLCFGCFVSVIVALV